MEKRTKVKIAALAAVALSLAIALGAAGAIAAERVLSTDEDNQAVIDDAAGQLGVEPSELSEALRGALKNRVDDAVEDGRLSEEEGERLKERIDSRESPPLFGAFGKHGFGPQWHFASIDEAASYLGVTEAELRERLREGETLADVAEEEGKSVDGLVEALLGTAIERVDEAVEDGRLDEERADELKAELEERITDLVNGERHRFGPPFGRGFGRGFGPGFGFEGPPFHRGPRA